MHSHHIPPAPAVVELPVPVCTIRLWFESYSAPKFLCAARKRNTTTVTPNSSKQRTHRPSGHAGMFGQARRPGAVHPHHATPHSGRARYQPYVTRFQHHASAGFLVSVCAPSQSHQPDLAPAGRSMDRREPGGKRVARVGGDGWPWPEVVGERTARSGAARADRPTRGRWLRSGDSCSRSREAAVARVRVARPALLGCPYCLPRGQAPVRTWPPAGGIRRLPAVVARGHRPDPPCTTTRHQNLSTPRSISW